MSEGMTGAEDLNAYGTWQSTPAGQDWVPPVDPGWVPYSDGDWSYVEPWGWTWIDAAPWGFAPYHYGRWGFANGRWVWYPGPRQTVQTYAPALVTFISGGSADSVSWFPLSPRDSWIPPWRPQPDGAMLARISSNRNAPGAIRTLPQSDFISGARVQPAIGLSSEGEVHGSSPLVMPVRESITGRECANAAASNESAADCADRAAAGASLIRLHTGLAGRKSGTPAPTETSRVSAKILTSGSHTAHSSALDGTVDHEPKNAKTSRCKTEVCKVGLRPASLSNQ